MNLRTATESTDLAAVRLLFREYVAGLGIDLCFQGFEEELSALPGKYAPPKGGIWLADEDEYAAGCVALRPFSGDACEMKRLYVRPEFRGGGVGKMLAERTLAAAIEAGYRRMYLDTLSTMTPAVTLYRGLGFVECPAYYFNPIETVVYFVKEFA